MLCLNRLFLQGIVICWCAAGFVLQADAAGFALYTQGASALGQGNAVTAHLEDPSAVFFNPALIGKLPGSQFQIGTTLIHASREFDSDPGGTSKEVSSNHLPSTFFATHQLSPAFTVGLGVFSPFGLGTDWGKDWEGRYISTDSDLTTFNINPVVCWQVSPRFAVAAGLDYLLMDATLEKNLNLAPLPDGQQKFSGDGDGLGFNLGLVLDLTEKATLGIHYRSEIDMDLDGSAEFSLPNGTPAQIAAVLSNSPGRSRVTLPQQAQLGVAYRFTENLIAEVGARWEDWSSFESQVITLDSGLISVTERNWDDVYAFNVGGRYDLNPRLALLAGYLFDNNPVPDQTFDPSIPASNAHLFSLGGEYRMDSWKLAMAYAYQHFQSRDKANTIGATSGGTANGRYQTDNHMVGLSVTYLTN